MVVLLGINAGTASDADKYNSYFSFTAGSTGIIKVKNKKIQKITTNLKKTIDVSEEKVKSSFKFELNYTQSGTTAKSKTIILGRLDNGTTKWSGSLDFQPTNKNDVTLEIKETCDDDNFEGVGTIKIVYSYDSANNNWKIKSQEGSIKSLTTTDYKTFNITVNNHYNPPVRLRFYKKDITGTISLSGAKMQIKKAASNSNIRMIEYGEVEYTNKALDLISYAASNGVFKISETSEYYTVKVRPNDNSKGYIKLDITELVSPNGYNLLRQDKKPVTVTITYDKDGTVTGISVEPKEYERLLELNKIWTNSDGVKYGIIRLKNDPRIIKGTKLYKYDKTGNEKVKGATFTAEFSGVTYVKINGNKINATGNKVTVTGLVSDANGLIANIQEIEALENSDTVYMTVTETKTITGFDILPNPVNLVLKYDKKDSSGGKWKLYENTSSNKLSKEFFEIKSDELTLKIKDDYKLDKLTILKTDSLDNNKVEGAKFDVTLENVKSVKGYSAGSSDTLTIQGVTTNKDGNIELEDVVIRDITKPLTITMVETEAPEGYKKIEGKVTVKLIRDGNAYKITEQSKDPTVLDSEFKEGNAKVEGNILSIGINDIPALEKLNLYKVDSQNNSNLTGAEFKIDFSNVESYYTNGQKKTDSSTTVIVNEGKALIEKVLLKDMTKEATITLEETKAPVGYKRIEGKIYLTVRYTDEGYTISATKDETVLAEKEFNTSDVGIENGKNAYVTMKDIPLINIGGIVWEDAQTGTKQISGPDGKLNNGETGISGIGVEIYNEKDERVYQDIYGDELVDTTAGNGQEFSYKLNNGNLDTISLNAGEYIFPNLEKGEYYVRFLYDGINYMTVDSSNNIYESTSPEKESKVTEEGRDAFNARFKTISPGQSNDGTKLGYDYNEAEKTSKLQVGIKGENPANDNEFDFQMKAKSENYLRSGDADWIKVWTEDGKINRDHYALDVNCGLIEKYFDLALGTDVKSARVTINGKEAKYDYKKIMDETLDLDEITQKQSSETDGIEYTLYLYKSDYNFRIQDYITDSYNEIKDTTQEEDYKEMQNKAKKDDELKVYVTYSIFLKNQSKQEGTVEEFEYYYDSKYINPTIKDDDYDYDIDDTNRKITFTHKGTSTLNNDNNYRKEIEVTFEVAKNENRALKTGEFSNAGEITKYSTPNGGFIDYDSAPGNAVFNTGEQKQISGYYEDDCDQAKGIKIEMKEEKTREITGNVFEDIEKKDENIEKDGAYNNYDQQVKDVIVQLIELKTIEGKYYEYIWQQTKSGANIVNYTTKNGNNDKATYTTDVTEDGEYKFKDFIPGNYIIRFIYGDGSTYDMNANVKKYNGQDYKSTKDIAYKNEWYNKAVYANEYAGAEDIANKVRDNEARRLEVMAYSTDIDKKIGETLRDKSEEALENTWMCAETSKVYVPVDNKEHETSDNGKNNIMFETSEEVLKLEHMNFGLTLRPNTKLKLEKHITALKITPQGTGVQPIVDAKIGDILEDLLKQDVDKVNVNGVKTGLAVIKSNRNDRGFWKVETDIEELAQGAKVEVEYRYIVKNESDPDYLSKTLVTEYEKAQEEGSMDSYNKNLGKHTKYIKNDMRTGTYSYTTDANSIGKYLGQFYYNGTKNDTDQEVPSAVTGIEDTINAEFKINEGAENDNAFEQDTNTPTDKYKYDVDGKREIMNNIATIQNKTGNVTKTLIKDVDNATTYTDNNTDYSLIVNLETTLSAASKEISYAGCLAQITHYTNAAGKRDIDSVPGNLEYVSSDDNELTLDSYVKYYNDDKEAENRKIIQVAKDQADAELLGGLFFKLNEDDEYWGLGGEKLIVSKPTGENKQAPVQIIVIAISSVAVIGVGIILIKKFVLKK